MMSNDNPASILAVESVNKTYPGGTKPALDRVSFRVAPGEFFSILGPSGSGKTTILRMIAGFETPDRGRILMDGADITEVPPNRRDVRTVFQSYALFPHLTVQDNVEYSLRMQGEAKAERRRKAGEALEMVDMLLLHQPAAASIVRRPAPARGAGPGHRLPPEDPAAGRAARRARSEAAPADAAHAGVAAEGARHRLHLCHPRPGRGTVDVEPHRGHAGRTHRPARHRAGPLFRADLRIRGAVRRPLQPDADPVRTGRRQAGREHRRRDLPGSRRAETGAGAPRLALRGRDHRAGSRGTGARRAHRHRRGRAVPRHQFRGQCAGRRPRTSSPACRPRAKGGFRAGQPVRLHLDLTNARVFND